MTNSDLLANSVKHVSFGIILQICLRIATFVVNACILRVISREVLGIINVRLTLLYSSIQFISREAFRRAAISDSKSHNWSNTVNVIWLNVPVSIIVGSFFSAIWIYCLHKPDPQLVSGYDSASVIIPISVLVEIIAEPAYIFGQLNSFLKLRIIIEGLAILLKCTLMIILTTKYPDNAVSVYAYSQLVSSIFYTLIYYTYFYIYFNGTITFTETFAPKINNLWNSLNSDLVVLVYSFFKQTVVKQLLTEGEKLVMTFFNPLTFAEQGIYEVINNLSSLPARFIFQPIEESGYILFSQLIDRNKPAKDQEKTNLISACNILSVMLKLMITFGSIVVVFGYRFSDIVLLIYGGSKLSSDIALTLMRCQCFYILLIAINGVSECFTFAAMNNTEISVFNKKMVRLSFIFLLSTFVFTKMFGSPGFIFANCLNMTGRIFESAIFTRKYYANTSVKSPFSISLIPNVLVLLSLLASFVFISIIEVFFPNIATVHFITRLCVGFFFFAIVLLTFLLKEQSLVAFIMSEFRKRKNKKE
ncbi:protein RFT1-like protein [Leptotrombidium deliense]|uniref:Protein RFT1 homolog n=1 Tax=Leptotrombidium deliense TaxID=299467 RepID=A0A443SUS3_9ACAR|nr:protein RFT1-like protein [Leptotrombidium deliense]